MGVIARAMGVVIQALYSDDPRRQMWGCDKLLSSWLARDHPLAPARRGVSASVGEARTVAFRWQSLDSSDDDPPTDEFERDGRTVEVPRYGGGGDRGDDPVEGEMVRPPASIEHEAPSPAESTPEPPQLPKWAFPYPPPPLLENKYQPWTPPQPKAQPRRERELALEPEEPPQRASVYRPSRGGWR